MAVPIGGDLSLCDRELKAAESTFPSNCGGSTAPPKGTEVGLTQGRGRMDRSGKAHGVRNHIFLFPLHRHWRERLGDPSPALSSSVDSVKECR